jgi:hypothetical protein
VPKSTQGESGLYIQSAMQRFNVKGHRRELSRSTTL